jgi:hypothetical protein
MFRFFRQIRQRLLTDNKFSKYLLYAIGEIVLVVIGILIALQVNNWDENNREMASLASTLKSANTHFATEIATAEKENSDLQKMIQNLEAAIEILQHVTQPNAQHLTILESALQDITKIGLRTYNVDILENLASGISDSKLDSDLAISISQLVQEIVVDKWISDEYYVPTLLNLRSSQDVKVLSRNLNGDFEYDFELMKTQRKFHEFLRYSLTSKRSSLIRNVEIVVSYKELNEKISNLKTKLEK